MEDNLKFFYRYENDSDKSKDIRIDVEGENRKELIDKLISKKNGVALYSFMVKFPNLSNDEKNFIETAIKQIEKIRNIDELIFPEQIYLLTREKIYYLTEKEESCCWVRWLLNRSYLLINLYFIKLI